MPSSLFCIRNSWDMEAKIFYTFWDCDRACMWAFGFPLVSCTQIPYRHKTFWKNIGVIMSVDFYGKSGASNPLVMSVEMQNFETFLNLNKIKNLKRHSSISVLDKNVEYEYQASMHEINPNATLMNLYSNFT